MSMTKNWLMEQEERPQPEQESLEDLSERVGVSLDDLAARVETLERGLAALLARKELQA